MPNWKKVIVSGSDAALSNLNVTGALTASAILADGITDVIRIIGSGSTANTTLFSVDGNNGRLFEISDDLSDSLFSVNTVAGLPVVEVFSDNRVIMGAFNQNDFVISGSKVGIGTNTPSQALTVEGSISASGALYLDGSLYDSNNQAGTSGQLLTSTATGIDWVDPTSIDVQAQQVYASVKNVSGTTLVKGTPVHAVSGSTSGNVNSIIAASASDASTMPATFILNEDLVNDAEGLAIAVGSITNVNTSAFTVGDVVYVGENGGYTNVKPTGDSNLIQNLGVVTKVHASNGAGFIYGSGRSNDVPNLPTGKIWVGSNNYTVTSSLVHLDESNGRLGIGTTTPTEKLEVRDGNIRISGSSEVELVLKGGNANPFRLTGDGTDFELLEASSRLRLRSRNAGDFSIYSRNGSNVATERLTVKDITGNVGIGNTDPTEKLTVQGNISASGDINASRATFSSTVETGNLTVVGNGTVQGDLVVTGKVTAEEFHTEFVSASIIFQSGSTKFGNSSDDVHSFTGSIAILSGSLDISSPHSQGRIIFQGDSSKFIRSTSVGNMQIGTTGTIQLYSTTQILSSNALRFSNADNGTNMHILNSANSGNNALNITDGTNTRMYISGSGNVGIGTTNPSESLEVNGNILVDKGDGGRILIKNGSQSILGLGDLGGGTDGQVAVYNDSGTLTSLINGGTSATYFNGGNVGIGNSSPATKLDVSGSVRIKTENPIIQLLDDNTSIRYAALQMATAGGNWFFSTGDSNTGSGLANSDLWITRAANGSDNRFRFHRDSYAFTVYSGSSARVRLDADGNSYFNGGSVGIGTTSPQATLNIKNTVGAYPLIVETPYDRVGKFISTDAGAELIIQDNSSTDNGNSISVNGDIMTLRTAGSNRLRILANGNVGIGTTSPATELDVSGSIRMSAPGPVLTANSTNQQSGLRLNVTNLTSGADLIRFQNSGTTLFKVKENGNVGIGNNLTATEKLHISGGNVLIEADSGAELNLLNTASGIKWQVVSGYNGGFEIGNVSSGDTDAQASFFIQNSTNRVGIGTTGPTQKLEVRDGNLVVSGSSSKVAVGTATGVPRIYSNANQDLLLATANQSGSVVYLQDANGYVGIGTSSPQKELHVNGAVSASTYFGDASNLSNVTTTDGLADILENNNSAGGFSLDMNNNDIIGVNEIAVNIVNGTSASLSYVTSSAGLFIDTNVGIGTAAPSQGLHVVDTGAIVAEFESSNNSISTIEVTNSSGNSSYFGTVGTSLTLGAGAYNSNDLVITTAGRVGIGETNPAYLFHVSGGTSYFAVNGTEEFSTSVDEFNTLGSDALYLHNKDTSATYGQVGIHFRSDASGGASTGKIVLHNERSGEGSFAFMLRDGSHTANIQEKMRITSDGAVGIGTDSPDEELEVKVGDAFVEISLESERDGTGENIGRVGFHGRNSGGTKIKYAGVKAEIDDAAESAEKGKLIFETVNGGTYGSHVAIDANGHMGVGTLDPSKPLHVNGGTTNFVALFESTDAKGGINLADNTTSTDGVSLYAIGDDFGIRTGGTDNKLYVSASGLVGIGAPASIRPDGSGDQLVVGSGVGNQGMTIYAGDSNLGSIYFADDLDEEGAGDGPVGSRDASIRYDHANNRFGFYTSGNQLELYVKRGGSTFNTDLTVNGDLTVGGIVTAQEFHTEFVSASIVYSSGSTKFGDDTGDNHNFTGSVIISGSTDLTLVGKTGNATFNVTDAGDLTIDADDDIRLDAGGGDVVLRAGGTEYGRISSFSNALRLRSSVANEDILLMPNGTGKVGIHTSSPSEALHVSGAMIIDSGSQATKLDSNRIAVSSIATVIADIDPTVYVGAVIDYTAYNDDKTTGMRTGQLMLAFDESTNVTVSDVSTTDIGDTSGVTFTATNNGSSVRLSYNTPDTSWNIRVFRRLL